MKQLILIVPSATTKNFNYVTAKKRITDYVGKRLIEEKEVDETVPGIITKEVLNEIDKETIKKIVFPEDGTIVFIEFDDDCESIREEYLDAVAK